MMYLILLPSMAALIVTLLKQFAGHKMDALVVMILRLLMSIFKTGEEKSNFKIKKNKNCCMFFLLLLL